MKNIEELSPRDKFKLFLKYDDGVSGEVDLSSLVGRGVFASWVEPGAFEQVRLAEVGHPEWPGDIDLCPDALYLQLTGKTPADIFPKLRELPTNA